MIDDPTALDLLLSRLLHYDCMVRVRTCSAVARLLNTPAIADQAREHLTAWMVKQELESTAVFGLLAWAKAKIDDLDTELPAMEELASRFPRPSLLSWMLMQELYENSVPEPEWIAAFSHGLHEDFRPDEFFRKHADDFIPTAYSEKAEEVTKRTGAPFALQWAWEWTLLVERLGIRLKTDPLFLVTRGDRPFVACFDFRVSEVYRSAFLRALAWAFHHGVLTGQVARWVASLCCPIDIGLWKVKSSHTPEWWPKTSDCGKSITDAPAQIIEQIKSLWKRQAPEVDDWYLTQCSGLIEGSDTHYKLEIYGAFQKCLGPGVPGIGEIIRRMCYRTFQPVISKNPLRLSGDIVPLEDDETDKIFADWECVPAFVRVESHVIPRWQWWRHFGRVWAPSLVLTDSGYTIVVDPTEIIFRSGPDIIGRWMDWITALRNTIDVNLPPAAGQALFVKGEVIRGFCSKEQYAFCWLWRLTAYHRKSDYGEYEKAIHEGQFGARGIILR